MKPYNYVSVENDLLGNIDCHNTGVFGDLEMLNRNQALQVLVNSPVHKQSFVHKVTVFSPWNNFLCSES
jgi:hypothetical protein